ncbi:hypothetical protein A3E49_02060 [Candidatus Saccharibacteria bacterium RIFCSPHIGHO2_12_FULL_49_19]|nr:MAG: hypothetical protein A2708_00600 [Candidatus Saccharibacteria bacterium RIFCSPHIGHO2_01_FULL_49_21]OGL36516.1 MAG: hypothetical protein A3E49_02060 [Candidatus Saccharibacteria bacterium RIFCSPHIGHO2_12_FULL_49_19]OGL38645.1 MAG: hypothetical protein A3B63_01210 [Candidatus Saccharibacteria bacterium RIFCSPLOWO2_01_FULL_49_22]
MESRLLSKRVLGSLGLISGLTLVMFAFRILVTGTDRYWFIPQNLALAWLALLFGWLLVTELKKDRWLSWQNLSLSVLWLVFLPNTWYVLTDFLHVFSSGEISQIYDIAMMMTLVVSGFVLGFISLYLIHLEFLKRWPQRFAHGAVAAVLLISSFGIYLGRDLRWNTWDVISHPEGLLINVSDRVINPLEHPRAVTVTVLFFVLLTTLYGAIWLAGGPHKVKRK